MQGILNGQANGEKEATVEREPILKSLASPRTYIWALGRIMAFLWPKTSGAPEKLRPTAYLDGLRGFAAFLVYIHHHELWAHASTMLNHVFENGFGYADHYFFVGLPVVRHFFAGGHFAVSTFFVISGYVLSLKPMSLLQAGEYTALGDNLGSALFRRWIRLFLPLIIMLTLYATFWTVFGIKIRGIKQYDTWLQTMWECYAEFKNFSFVFKEGGVPWLSYHFHLWSIPVEFKGSIVIYTVIMALSRCRRDRRLLCELALIFYFMYIVDGWYCAMFMSGLMLCDLDQLAKKNQLPEWMYRLEPYKTFIFYHLFFISMFLGGVPAETKDIVQLGKSRGWYYLSFLVPQAVFDYKWFFLYFAATFLVASTPRIHWLKYFFETRFCQYLGRISYALYMMHGPVLWVLGDRIYCAVGWVIDEHKTFFPGWVDRFPLPRTSPVGLELAFLVPHIILLPLTIFVSDLVTRAIDTPSVQFANWLYKQTLPEAPERNEREARRA
jgi:peptidoglycan/LPS O-acetylase OafA/YrhL